MRCCLIAVLILCAASPAALTPAEIAGNQARALRNRAATQIDSLRRLRAAAESGDPLAQYYFATLLDPNHLRESRLIEPDAALAVVWYRKAVPSSPAAAFSLGALYAAGQGVGQDIRQAARLAAQAADAGYVQAQVSAADLFTRCDLPRDPARATHWLAQAAAQGNAGAVRSLAVAYALGRAVPKDYAGAARLLRQPVQAPSPADREAAMLADAYTMAVGSVETCRAPIPAADVLDAIAADAVEGDPGASYLAGRLCLGLLPMPPDVPQAVRWFFAAASKGDANSAFALGQIYRDGSGAPRDRVKAAGWFLQAAEKGDAPAAFELANLYNIGIRADFEPPDYARAVRWYRAAADLNYAPAQTALGLHYEAGYGVPRDSAQAARWYRRAVALADPEAADFLGKLYQNGSGVPRDVTQAVRLFTGALESGNDAAGCDLAWLYLQGLAGPEDPAARCVEAYKWYDIVCIRCATRDRCLSGAAEAGRTKAGLSLDPTHIKQAHTFAIAWLDAHGEN